MMRKTMAVMLVAVAVAVSFDVCHCSLGFDPDDFNVPSSQDPGPSWPQPTYNEAFHSEHVEPRDADRHLMESAGNTAAKTKDTLYSAASEASKYTCKVADKACETASSLKDVASDMTDNFIRMVGSNIEYGKDSMAEALHSSGLSGSVDFYDFHGDWPSEDDEKTKKPMRGSGTSYSKLDHHIARMKNNEADGSDSDSESDFSDHIDYGRSRLSNSYNQDRSAHKASYHIAREHRVGDSYDSAMNLMSGQAKGTNEPATGAIGGDKMKKDKEEL